MTSSCWKSLEDAAVLALAAPVVLDLTPELVGVEGNGSSACGMKGRCKGRAESTAGESVNMDEPTLRFDVEGSIESDERIGRCCVDEAATGGYEPSRDDPEAACVDILIERSVLAVLLKQEGGSPSQSGEGQGYII